MSSLHRRSDRNRGGKVVRLTWEASVAANVAKHVRNANMDEKFTGRVRVLVEGGQQKARVPLVPRLEKIKAEILRRAASGKAG